MQATDTARAKAMIGTTLAGRYRIDALLGEGGMGAVYRGHHVHLKRDFAIKVLHPDITRDPDVGRRFEREAQSAARLDHPNCIQVTEFGTTDSGTRYMVMQLLEGIELHDLIRGPMEPLRALDLFLQILAGLEHAHGRGVVHRDLKPQNVFVSRESDGKEVLKIVDFGIAKLVSGEGAGEAMTRAGMVFGTPLYMSPEQCLGVQVDARSDLYSAGILLYLMLSGKLPFVSDDPVAVIRMQVSQDPPPLPDSVPEDLATIVFRLLAKQRDARFPDAKTVRKLLESYRKGLASRLARGDRGDRSTRRMSALAPTPAFHTDLPDALKPRTTSRFELGRATPWLIGVVVVGLIGAAVIVVLFRGQALDEADEAAETTAQVDAGAEAVDAPPPAEVPGPTDDELAAIDAAFRENRYDEGVLLLGPLRERFPEHAGLLWREGWLLNWRDKDRIQALSRYRDAVLRDPSLHDNQAFVRDLIDVLQAPEVRAQAVDLALELGQEGHELLVNFVNDPDVRLGFNERHRIFKALAGEEETLAKVDRGLNLLHDLDQHREAPRPCVALTDALEAIAAAADPAFIEPVDALVAPNAPEEASVEEKEACAALPEVLAATQAALKPKKKKKRRTTKKKTTKKKKKR
ncbi:MAG: serine/threonine-protein kinase [Nannocystaceae bacterium]